MAIRARTRRQFLHGGVVLVGLAFSAACASLPAPMHGRPVRRIGYLASGPPNAETWPAFQATMRDLGYVEGENLLVEYRFATGEITVVDAAAELVGLQPEVIVVPSVTDARAARAATTTIPIVSAGNGDLVASGVVASQGRPGGNVTGLTTPLLAGKQLEILRE